MAPLHHDPVMLTYLRAVHEFSSLVPSLLQFAEEDAVSKLALVFTGDLSASAQQAGINVEVTNEMAQISHLVLPEHAFALPIQEPEFLCSGTSALEFIRASVFPQLPSASSSSSMLQDLLHGVRYTTVLQAHQAREVCLATLLMSVRTSNCLALLTTATRCGCIELAKQSLDVCLADVKAAVKADVKAFSALPLEVLLHLLGQDGLDAKEDEVLVMLVQWVNADTKARSSLLSGAAGRCLRPSLLNYDQLVSLDEHPDICKNYEAISLVASLFISLIMEVPSKGAAHDKPRNCTNKKCPL